MLLIQSLCFSSYARGTLGDQLVSAEQYYSAGRMVEAVHNYRSVLQQIDGSIGTKDRIKANLGLAKALQELGHFEDALESVKVAIQSIKQSNQIENLDELRIIELELHLQMSDFTNVRKKMSVLVLNQNSKAYEKLLLRKNMLQLRLLADQKDAESTGKFCNLVASGNHSAGELLAQFYTQCGQLLTIDKAPTAVARGFYVKAWEVYAKVPASRISAKGLLDLSRALVFTNADSNLIDSVLGRAKQFAETIEDQFLVSEAEGLLGMIKEKLGLYGQAIDYYRAAVRRLQNSDLKPNLYRWQWFSGRCLKKLGDHSLAVKAYRNALKSLEDIQAAMLMSDLKLSSKSIFETSIEPVYYELAEILVMQANQESDQSKRRQYLLEARNTIESMRITELQDYLQDECSVGLRAYKNKKLTLPSDLAILHIIPFQEKTAMLITVGDQIDLVMTSVGIGELRAEVDAFRKRLQDITTRRYLNHGRTLYKWLITPAKKILDKFAISTLVMVPDRSLRKIPLGALVGDNKYLLNEYAVVTTQGMNLLNPRDSQKIRTQIFTAGLSESRHGFSPLRSVSNELNSICSFYKCKPLMDKGFQKQIFRKTLEEDSYAMIHLASHGELAKKVEDSFILTWDGRLSMNALESCIGASSSGDRSLDLLSLSACQTAAGDDRAALGLAGMSIKAGARSALASLWFVSDVAASKLFIEFYKFLQSGTNKANALRQAQLKLIDSTEFRHPMFWSPFILVGNWN